MASTSTTPQPDDVLKFTAPTKGFLCPITANTYGIDFLSFKIRDVESNKTVFEVAKDPNQVMNFPADFDFDQLRKIDYKFNAGFLDLQQVGTKLVFKVGDKPVRNFRMIERHYHKDKLLKSYDFNFKFCIPNTTNEWEAMYDLPKMDDDLKHSILEGTFEDNQSDSFYFVEGQLVMHNKARYAYVDNQGNLIAKALGGKGAEVPEKKSD